MNRLVEAVPNFSEGRDPTKIARIAEAIIETQGAHVLHVDPGYDANRTVITLAGTPEAVIEGLFNAFKVAQEVIDMHTQTGAHPRMGAVDVCPLVPLNGVSFAECVQVAHRLGQRVGHELNIPVVHYELAASAPHRKLLGKVRKGEFEGWQQKIREPEWQPDHGPAEVGAAGVSVIGVRPFLGAYNVNLESTDVDLAKAVAGKVRETGYWQTSGGTRKRVPGELAHVRAIGWWMPEFDCVQVSTNLTRLDINGFHAAYTTIDRHARALGSRAAGSELIGLVPKAALMEVARNMSARGDERTQLQAAADFLGLNSVRDFSLTRQVLEYRLGEVAGERVPTLPILPPEL